MNANFGFLTNLQYKVKSLGDRVQAFESGEKYTKMKSASEAQLSAKDIEIRKLKSELADTRTQAVTTRKQWEEVFEDLIKEHKKSARKKRP
jgi:hypothetical protein